MDDPQMDAEQSYLDGLRLEGMKRYDKAVARLRRAAELRPNHAKALERLGALVYAGLGTAQCTVEAIELLSTAVRLDPDREEANLYLALALAREDRRAEARRRFEQAMRIDSHPPIAMSTYADSLADWGCFDEAEALFQRALEQDPYCVLALRDYGRTLIRSHNPTAESNIARAVELFTRAVAADPDDPESHYRLGDALLCVEGEEARAIVHLKRSLALHPAHPRAAARLAEIEADPEGDDPTHDAELPDHP